MTKIPIVWKKPVEMLKKLSYPTSIDGLKVENGKTIYHIYIDEDGNLVVVTDE